MIELKSWTVYKNALIGTQTTPHFFLKLCVKVIIGEVQQLYFVRMFKNKDTVPGFQDTLAREKNENLLFRLLFYRLESI